MHLYSARQSTGYIDYDKQFDWPAHLLNGQPMLINGDRRSNTRKARRGRSSSTWYDDRVNSLVIALDEPSKGSVEDGTKVEQPWLEAVR